MKASLLVADSPAGGLGFWQATLDSLADNLAVLEADGTITAVNAAWTRFAENNGGVDVGVGANYLSVCDLSADSDAMAARVAVGLRAVLAGEETDYSCVYPCHAPWEQRWFTLRVSQFAGSDGIRVVVSHHEITERHLAEARSHEQAGLLDAVDAAIVAVDLSGAITYWSQGAEDLHGWGADEVLGRAITDVIGQGDGLGPEITRSTLELGRWDGNFDVARRDGTSFPAYVRTRLLRDTEGVPSGMVGISVDMTEPAAMERRLRGTRDFLAAVTHTMPDGLIVVDSAGRITLVNGAAETMLGWPAADLLGQLKHETIHALRADGSTLPADQCPITIARLAGTPIRVEDDVFQRRDGSLLPVYYSAAPFSTESGDAGSVVVFGDNTEAKERERAVQRQLEALSWVGRIRDALDDHRLVLYAQPIVEIASGKTIQHELLVRMIGRQDEIIAPGAFLPVAEAHGLIQAIDRRVLELAMPYALAGHRIEVNLSADSISDPQTLRFVRDQLAKHAIDPSLIVFEITETALIPDEAVAKVFIENVRELGCGVALDDFGTGFGSFRYLKHLPVDLLKIDQEFVQDLEGEASRVNRHVVEAIVTLARGMGQLTVAEGVETQGSLEVLRGLGVDYAQGYLLARPALADDVFDAIEKERTADA